MIQNVKQQKTKNALTSATYNKLKNNAQNHINTNIHMILWPDEFQSLLDEGFKVKVLTQNKNNKLKCLVSFDSPTPRTLSMKMCKISWIT